MRLPAKALELGMLGAQLIVGRLQAMRELAHDGDGHGREFLDQPQEQLLGNPERDEAGVWGHPGRSGHVAEKYGLAQENVWRQRRGPPPTAPRLPAPLG